MFRFSDISTFVGNLMPSYYLTDSRSDKKFMPFVRLLVQKWTWLEFELAYFVAAVQ